VARNMVSYFGLYSISGELDKFIVLKDSKEINWRILLPSIVALQVAFMI